MLLETTAIFLATAVVAAPLFKRLGLGSVLGYLVGGAVIGPSGLGLIQEVEATLHFAEFGVVLLLFIIGLELQPSRLWRLRGAVFGLGGAQVIGTGALLAGVGWALGLGLAPAVVAGLALAMSSTAFATQILGERRELAAPHGRAAFGILLFQDLAAIPLLAIVPMLGAGSGAADGGGAGGLLLAAGVIGGLVIAGRFLLRPIFRFIASARSHELSVATALLVVLGTSIVMEQVGLSMALGAFIAGVLLADSEYRHELEANIEPFKGLLLGLFFLAVGMSANLRLLVEEPLTLVGLALGLVALKGAALFGLGRAFGQPTSSASSLAVSISQGGEFAFVVFGVGIASGVLAASVVERLVVVVTLSMVLTPLLFIARDRLEARRAAKAAPRPFDAMPDEASEVIIAGFGRFGQIVARVLRLRRISFTALDVSAEHVDFVRRFGNKIYYGDASRLDLLRAAKVEHARLFVLAIDDVEASMRTLRTVREHFPGVRVIARARNRPHAYALLAEGVEVVVRETFAGSLEAARRALQELGFSVAEATRTTERFAEYDERQVQEMYVHREDTAKLIASAQHFTAELERLFEDDARQLPPR
jgi:glutathione-regulated potassium-efflux system ancillary protein KefC